MEFSEEFWVRLYVRDSTSWCLLSWQAQGLFCLLLRKVDRAGVLKLGPAGLRAVCAHVGGMAAWPAVEPALRELLDAPEPSVIWCEEQMSLLIPRYVEAQTARATPAARKAAQRQRNRQLASSWDVDFRDVTKSDRMSHGEDAGSKNDTKSHASEPEMVSELQNENASKQVDLPGVSQNVTKCPLLDQSRSSLPAGGGTSPPPPPSDRNPPRADPKAIVVDLDTERVAARAWATWRAMYETSRRGYGTYVGSPRDGSAVKAIARAAIASTKPFPSDDRFERVGELLQHWFAEFLRSDGQDGFLARRRHPLHYVLEDLTTFGTPWRRPKTSIEASRSDVCERSVPRQAGGRPRGLQNGLGAWEASRSGQ